MKTLCTYNRKQTSTREEMRVVAEREKSSKFISGHPRAGPTAGDKFHREHRPLSRTSTRETLVGAGLIGDE